MSNTQELKFEGSVVFKATKHGIVTLIRPNNAENNEHRKNILPLNKNKAKYRCRFAYVKKIVNAETGEEMESDFSCYDKEFKYEVGKVVYPKYDYDIRENEICSSGIHYFLTEEMARNWFQYRVFYMNNGKKNPTITGEFQTYRDDGSLWASGQLINGVREGIWEVWKSKSIKTVTNYFKGIKQTKDVYKYSKGTKSESLEYNVIKYTYFNGEKDHMIEYNKNGEKAYEIGFDNTSPIEYHKSYRKDVYGNIYLAEFSMFIDSEHVGVRYFISENNKSTIRDYDLDKDRPNIIDDHNWKSHTRIDEKGNVCLTIEDLMRKNGFTDYI